MHQIKIRMKKTVFALILLVSFSAFAQQPCELDADVNDTLGTYKATKQHMIFERNFAGNSNNVFFTLTNTNGILGLDIQMIQSSADFIKANCLDSNSRIYLQLNNGKIVTLLFVGNETCGTLLHNERKGNSRITTGTFVFSKENFEDIKKSPVTFMRIKFSGETIDYPFKSGFVSELDKKMYKPETFFMDYMKCVDSN